MAKFATEQQAKLQKGREERKIILKQHQANQAAQAPDNEAEPPVELPVEPLHNSLSQPAAELIPQTSQNPKDRPKTKPKAKPKSVSEGMMEEPKEKESEMEDVPQKAVNKCEQHSDPISEEQGEEKHKRVRTGPLNPDTSFVGQEPIKVQ